jgi:UDP-N-acetylglucosamine acyltransferase
MATEIHPSAVVHPNARIGRNCKIGPFCTLGPHVQIGEATQLQSHVVIDGWTRLGMHCTVFPFASLGVQSQDLKFKEGNITYTEIGDHTVIREHVTVHSGTDHGTATRVGNSCALLALSHVGHNCMLGNHVVLSHGATLGGHVVIEDHCNLGGLSAVHQFVRIGENAMVAGMARLVQDVLPFTIAEGSPAVMRSINKIGMSRRGIDATDIRTVHRAYRMIFRKGLRVEEGVERLHEEFPDHPLVRKMIDFIGRSGRGLARPPSKDLE